VTTPSDMVSLYMQAEMDLLAGKTVTLNGKTLAMEDLAEIRKGRHEWERRVHQEARRGPSLARFS